VDRDGQEPTWYIYAKLGLCGKYAQNVVNYSEDLVYGVGQVALGTLGAMTQLGDRVHGIGNDWTEEETDGKQIPIYEAAISGRFCFKTVDNQCGKTVNIYSSFLEGVEDIQSLELEDEGEKTYYRGQVKDGKPHGKSSELSE